MSDTQNPGRASRPPSPAGLRGGVEPSGSAAPSLSLRRRVALIATLAALSWLPFVLAAAML